MKALALAFLVACGSSQPAVTQSTQTSEGSAVPPARADAGEAAAGPGLGEPCGPDDTCGASMTCVSYYGIAGKQGPEFKTCEIKCTEKTDCPATFNCVTIADGPGQVCRP